MHESQESSSKKFILVAPSDRRTAHAIHPRNAFRGDVVGSMTLVRLATAKGGKETCKGYDRELCFGQSDALNFGDL
jgi:hypothetical protein